MQDVFDNRQPRCFEELSGKDCFEEQDAENGNRKADADFADDFCKMLIEKNSITPDSDVTADDGIEIRKRGNHIFIMNFTDSEKKIAFDKEYINAVSGEKVSGEISLGSCKYIIIV